MALSSAGTRPLALLLAFLPPADQAALRATQRTLRSKLDLLLGLHFQASPLCAEQAFLLTQLPDPSVLQEMRDFTNQQDLQVPAFSQVKKFGQNDLPLALHPVLDIIGVLCFPEDLTAVGRMKLSRAKRVLRLFRQRARDLCCDLDCMLPSQLLNFYSVWTAERIAAVQEILRTWAGLWKENRMRQAGALPLQLFRWVNKSMRNYWRLREMSPEAEGHSRVCLRLREVWLAGGLGRVGFNRVGSG